MSESPKRRPNTILTTDTVIARRAYRPPTPPERLRQGPANRHEFLAIFAQENIQNDRHTRKRRPQSTPPPDSHEKQHNAQGVLRPKLGTPALTYPHWFRHHLGWDTRACRNKARDCDYAHYFTGHVPDIHESSKVLHATNAGYFYPKQFRCAADSAMHNGRGRPCKYGANCKYRHQREMNPVPDGACLFIQAHQGQFTKFFKEFSDGSEKTKWINIFIGARKVEFDKFLKGKGVLHKTDDDSDVDEKTEVKEEPENSD